MPSRAYAVLDTVLDTMQEGVVAVDPQGAVLMHNRAASRMFQLAGEVPAAAEWPARFGLYVREGEQLCVPQDTPFARALRGEAGHMVLLVRNPLAPAGRLLRCDYRPLENTTRDTSGGLVVFNDITELERAQSHVTGLEAAQRALRDTNQELEAFSYSVSHDLRAPLGAIGGFSAALADRLGDVADEKSRHYLARIRASVDRMEQLIEGLLGLSRLTRVALDIVDVDLSALAREVVEGLQDQAPARQVDVVIEEGLVAHCDLRLMRVLLGNLLGNAWKFTSRNETSRIELGRDDAQGAFFVRDNGVGFDMAHAGKLFSAFQRLHIEAEFPGTGIGLATVRRIVARHGGRVWAESQPGNGTTVWFTLSD
ncbi:ATP-binding protein [Ramlibacter albus]|uniref:histidine kinase n=1 Tax=Ramlibacter albus TaxID=2079448 RepID=A0A923S173_9BURK|nr:ATP-binding protein [Ramlibacter albus]MBC5763358.1 PAS domain-containing protein [Ramlibacter albus]